MKNVKEGKRRLAIIILSMVLAMAACPFALPGQYGSYAATTVEANSWADIVSAVASNPDDGKVEIDLKKDIAAGNSITIEGKNVTISGSGTIYVAPKNKYDSMFLVKNGGRLTINNGVNLSAKLMSQAGSQTCPDVSTYTADNFTGKVSADGKTYEPKGFFIHVEEGGSATVHSTISDFITSRDKDTSPRFVAPVVACGDGATFDLGETGAIKNNLVGYIVKDAMANNDAQTIKRYIKGAGPNVPRVPNAATQKANSSAFAGRPRSRDAGIDDGVPGFGVTATAGAIIYKNSAKGSIEGTISNNRGDTGGIMVSGTGSQVKILGDTLIEKNVGVQFGGGTTAEQGGRIIMADGTMSKNVAWFGGGAVYATENGVDWLLGHMSGDDKLSPDFDARKDGAFYMEGGTLSENTAFTRGGAVLADSDGVNIQKGDLCYNMSRMLGGAMYVMGDHPKYEYTVQMTGLYVHDNAAVSGEKKARDAVSSNVPTGDILKGKWDIGSDGLTWDDLNSPMQTLLQDPTLCGDPGVNILSGNVTGGDAKGNTDDWMDGTGAQGTGGGVWLCAYGNTIFDADKPNHVIITNNWATGAPGSPYNPSGAYHKTLGGSDLEDAKVNSAPSDKSRSGVAGGSDFHADTGGKGTVVINGLTSADWTNENTKVKYESTVSNGRLNLINNNTDAMEPASLKVNVYGNLSRHGGGLASDGTYIFGTAGDQATPSASFTVEKRWVNSVAKAPVTIRVTADTVKGEAKLADVPLDGEANAPVTEFDSVEELAPGGNTWKGRFHLPMSVAASRGEAKVYTLVYTGDYLEVYSGFTLEAGMELDPFTPRGKAALGKVISENKQDKIKVLFGQPHYADNNDPKTIATSGGDYKLDPISFRFDEFKDNGKGKLIPCDDYIFTPEVMDLSNIKYSISATPHYESTYNPVTHEITHTNNVLYNIYLFEIPMKAAMSNDNQPLTEKYVNHQVHTDIVNFDQEFTYDIMAYVPETATEITLSDTLVKGLEFADKDGNPSSDPGEVVQSMVVKYANNHRPGEKGSVVAGDIVKTANTTPIDFIAWEKNPNWANKGYLPQMKIEGSTLTVKIDEKGYINGGNNPYNLQQARGRWVQVTFNARIKDEYRSIEGLKKLKAEVEDKDTSWETPITDKRSPEAYDLVVANGDLDLVAQVVNSVGPDPIIWAVEAPSRLFARSARGEYYATPFGDKTGTVWKRIDKDGSEQYFDKDAWNNANNRYNGLPPHAYDTKGRIPLDDVKLNELKKQPLVMGHKIIKAAEGGSRLFLQTEDPDRKAHYFATPDSDKTGGIWHEIKEENGKPYKLIDGEWKDVSSDDGKVYKNALARLKPDSGTIRMLDLDSKPFTIKDNVKNWPVISKEKHEGMANQGTYNVVFGNGAKGTYKTNTVTVNPEAEELEITKIWKNAGKDELPSPENFKEFLILKANGKDVTKQYADLLTVTDNKDFTYTAKWAGLPKLKNVSYSYEVDEKPIPGFVTEINGTTITNTKTREEKPEIEKYVSQAVHKDITLDEVFTYDIIAYITKDADSFIITDKLNDVLCFAHKAEDVKVADLGEANNHLVTNNISAVKVNDNASVAGAGTPITGTSVNINGQTLTVSLSNKMKPVTEDYDPVNIENINPHEKGYYEQTSENVYVDTEDMQVVSGKTYYARDPSGSYRQVDNPTNDDLDQYYELTQVTKYVLTKDTEANASKAYYREDDYDKYTPVTIKPVDPKAEGYYEKSGESFVKTNDTKADPAKTYYIRVKITDGSRGYEYDGDVQPVTSLRGHWVKVTFRARIKPGLKLSDVKKAFSTIKNDREEDRAPDNKGNAPVVSGENHKGIPNDAAYTIGVAGEAGIKEGVYGDRSNTVTVKPSDNSGSDGDDSDEGDRGNKDGDKKRPGKSQGADTGDNSPLTLFLILPVVSALALLALRRRY